MLTASDALNLEIHDFAPACVLLGPCRGDLIRLGSVPVQKLYDLIRTGPVVAGDAADVAARIT